MINKVIQMFNLHLISFRPLTLTRHRAAQTREHDDQRDPASLATERPDPVPGLVTHNLGQERGKDVFTGLLHFPHRPLLSKT